MKESKGKNIIIVILAFCVVALSCAVIYLYMIGSDASIDLGSGNDVVDNDQLDEKDEKIMTEGRAILLGKELYDKTTEIYETWVFVPYCGYRYENFSEVAVVLGDSAMGNGNYFKSNFSGFEDLVDYLGQWLSEDIIKEKVMKSYEWNGEVYYKYVEDLSLLSGGDIHYSYVDYVLKDGVLYCRLDSGKGWVSRYLNIYDITVSNIEENRITYNIKSTYVNQDGLSSCNSDNVVSCTNDQIEYKDTKFVIEKNNEDNWVVAEYTLHE